MGFSDRLRKVFSSGQPGTVQGSADSPRDEPARPDEETGDHPVTPEAPFADATAFDRTQWRKKLKRILEELPASEPEWADLQSEARALGFDPDWVDRCEVEEFILLIRRVVSDRVFTDQEHRKLDLARDLIGIPDAEAEAALNTVVAEAEAFFGKPVEGV